MTVRGARPIGSPWLGRARQWGQALAAALFLGLLPGCQTLTKWTSKSIDQSRQPFQDEGEFREWFANYYLEPHPERLTVALEFMDRNHYLDEFPDIAAVFLGRVMSSHSESVAAWLADWDQLSGRQWDVVLLALWLADTPESRGELRRHLSRSTPGHRQRLTALLARDPKTADLLAVEPADPRQISQMWAAFSATGDNRYVRRVISYLTWYGAAEGGLRRAIGEVAMLSLAASALQHEQVATLCEEQRAAHDNPQVRAMLKVMLLAVAKVADDLEHGGGRPPRRPLPAH